MSSSYNYLSKNIVKDGTVMPISEALSTSGLTDEKGNTIKFTEPLPKYHIESNGFAYSLQDLEKVLVTLRVGQLPEEEST
jgi:hypothetical protein